MAYVQRYAVSLTTAADGSATGYTEVANGRVFSISYVDTDLDAGADLTATTETTAQPVLTAANFGGTDTTWHPRVQVHDAADASAATLDGTRKNLDYVWAATERIKLVLAQGGNVKSGTFYVVVG